MSPSNTTNQLVCELPHYTKNPFGQELPRNPPTKKKNNDLKLKDNKTQKKNGNLTVASFNSLLTSHIFLLFYSPPDLKMSGSLKSNLIYYLNVIFAIIDLPGKPKST